MAIKAGEAFLELSVRDSKFGEGLKRAVGRLKESAVSLALVGAGITALGGAITATFGTAASTFATIGDQLAKMSARTGAGVEVLSRLAYAAKQSGVDLQSLEETIKLMQRNLSGLGKGGKQTARALMALGVDANTLRTMLPTEQLRVLLDALGNIENPTLRAGAAMALFGRSGTQILPLIGHWKQLSAEAEHFGLTVSKQSAEKAERLNSEFGLLSATFTALKYAIGGAIGDNLANALRSMSECVATVTKWVEANKPLIATTSKLGGVLVGFGVAIVAVAAVLPTIEPAIAGISAVIDGLSAPFGIVKTVLATLASTIGFLFTPFGAIVGIILAAGGAFLYFSGIGGKIVKFLGDKFAVLADIFGETFSAISDALSGGDIIAAANVLWAGLKLAWLRGTEELRVAWAAFSSDALAVITNFAYDVQMVWASMASGIKSTWATLVTDAQTIGEKVGHALSRQKDVSDEELKRRIALLQEVIDRGGGDRSFGGEVTPNENIKILKRELAYGEERRRQLQAAQDDAHNKALEHIKDEGKAAQDKIEEERKAKLAAIAGKTKTPADQQAEKDAAIKAAKDAAGAAQKAFDEARRKAHEAKGKKFGEGFDDKAKAGAFNIAEAARGITRSTFSGKLATQIFGGGTDDVAKKHLTVSQKTNAILKLIERKMPFTIGEPIKIGNT